jgi:signal transduction histidine kinase
LTVRDDGGGFVAEGIAGSRGNHFGLAVMSERAERLGGVLSVSSGVGVGTEILLSAPARTIYRPEVTRKLSGSLYE